MALPYVTPNQLDKAMKTVDSKLEESLPKSSKVKEITVTEDNYNEENQRYELNLKENGYYLVQISALEHLSEILIDFKEPGIIVFSPYVYQVFSETDGCTYEYGFGYADTANIIIPVQGLPLEGLSIIKMGKLIVVSSFSEEL